jgi:hypothetical protein
VQHFFDRTSGKIDYKNLVQDVYDFDYKKAMGADDNVPASGNSMRSEPSEDEDFDPPKNLFDDDYIVLD